MCRRWAGTPWGQQAAQLCVCEPARQQDTCRWVLLPAHSALCTMCRFAGSTSVALVTHGLALRLFLMRWLHWSVDDFL